MNVNNLVKPTLYPPGIYYQNQRVFVPQTIYHARIFWINILACEYSYVGFKAPQEALI